jgi:hypothetical protein
VDIDLEMFDRVLGFAVNLLLAGHLGLLRLLLPGRPVNLLLQIVGEAAESVDLTKKDGWTWHGFIPRHNPPAGPGTVYQKKSPVLWTGGLHCGYTGVIT